MRTGPWVPAIFRFVEGSMHHTAWAGRRPEAAARRRSRSQRSRTTRPSLGQDPALDLRALTILIVEDHEDSREMLRDIVESLGATVVLANDGYDAIKKASSIPPDLVLCDLRMPGL